MKRRSRSRMAGTSVPRNPLTRTNNGLGFPKQFHTTHKFVDNIPISSSSGSIGSLNVRCNGLYNPTYGATHSAHYFDQLKGIYDHYTVIASRITINIGNTTMPTTPSLAVLYLNDDDTLSPSYITERAEQPQSRSIILPAGNINTKSLSLSWNGAANFGNFNLNNPEFRGTGTTNPSEYQSFSLCLQSMDGLSSNSAICELVVYYDTVWTELKDLS